MKCEWIEIMTPPIIISVEEQTYTNYVKHVTFESELIIDFIHTQSPLTDLWIWMVLPPKVRCG